MSTLEALQRTRAIIAERGHAKGNPFDRPLGEGVCLEEALGLAQGIEYADVGYERRLHYTAIARTEAYRVIRAELKAWRLWYWNDGASEEDILNLLDKIIAGLDGPSRTITVEPIEEPVIPRETPSEPAEPAEAPEKTPEREPEKVPAGA